MNYCNIIIYRPKYTLLPHRSTSVLFKQSPLSGLLVVIKQIKARDCWWCLLICHAGGGVGGGGREQLSTIWEGGVGGTALNHGLLLLKPAVLSRKWQGKLPSRSLSLSVCISLSHTPSPSCYLSLSHSLFRSHTFYISFFVVPSPRLFICLPLYISLVFQCEYLSFSRYFIFSLLSVR
jgi:hypothetical protein